MSPTRPSPNVPAPDRRSSHDGRRQPSNDRARMEHAPDALRPVGRIVLLRRDRGARTAAAHHRGAARRHRGHRAAPHHPHPRRAPAEASRRLGSLCCHGVSQQPGPVRADRLGPDPDRERGRLDPERHHAAVHGPVGALAHHRREDDRRSPAGRRGFHRRRRHDWRRGLAGARRRIPRPTRDSGGRRLLRVRRRVRSQVPRHGRHPRSPPPPDS